MKKIIIGNKIFKTQTECEKYTRSILTELGITDSVKNKNEEYFNYLILLCRRHPHHIHKLNKFVDFKIYQDTLNKRALALTIVNRDNTYTEISWKIRRHYYTIILYIYKKTTQPFQTCFSTKGCLNLNTAHLLIIRQE